MSTECFPSNVNNKHFREMKIIFCVTLLFVKILFYIYYLSFNRNNKQKIYFFLQFLYRYLYIYIILYNNNTIFLLFFHVLNRLWKKIYLIHTYMLIKYKKIFMHFIFVFNNNLSWRNSRDTQVCIHIYKIRITKVGNL